MQLLVLMLFLRLLAAVAGQSDGLGANEVFSLLPNTTRRLSLEQGTNYTFAVNASDRWKESHAAFVFQLHTQQYNITLTNGSSQCTDRLECSTTGSNVGMVTLLWQPAVYYFIASVECGPNCRNESIPVLVAAVPVPVNAPIPGGCSLTSSLEIDPQLHTTFSTYNTTLYFQDSNLGYSPKSAGPPQCDSPNHPSIKYLKYNTYRKCLGAYNFDISVLFDAIEDMLTLQLVLRQDELHNTLTYNQPKRVLFDSSVGQGVVYNVLAIDVVNGTMSAYVPAATYACNFNLDDSSCHPKTPVVNIVMGVILGLVGLFLCFLGQRFFHAEVPVFCALIFSYVFLLLLAAITTWSHTALVVGSVLLGIAASLPLFLLWFFTGWYYIFVILYGAAMGFLITATLFFTPFGHLTNVFQINYVYILCLVCGTVVFMVPLVAFPKALNIWCSSLIGSYAVVFAVSMFTHTELSDIVLRVVKNAMIQGYITTQSDCPFQLVDIILSCTWVVLLVLGITIQAIISKIQEKKFYRKQREKGYTRDHVRYSSFPSSPYKLLKKRFSHCRPEQKPLLSPGRPTSPGYGYGNVRFM